MLVLEWPAAEVQKIDKAQAEAGNVMKVSENYTTTGTG
jgi:hypothetical protein